MKKTKQFTLIICLILFFGNRSYSQQQNALVSLSSGPTFTNAEEKNNQQGNGYYLQADCFIPFYRKGWDGSVKGRSFTLGMNLGISYISLKNLPSPVEVIGEKYQVNSGITNVSNNSLKKYSANFSGLAGLRAQFAFNKFIISPIISTGYISLKQEGHVQTGNFSVNGQSFTKVLKKQDEVKKSGFLVKPELRFGYMISKHVQLYLGSAFTVGPQMNYSLQTLVPQGGFKENNSYEMDQIKNGIYAETKVKSRYKTTEIQLGIGIGLGSTNNARAGKKPRGKITKPGDNGMLRTISNSDSTKNPLYEPGGINGNNPLYNPAIFAKPGSPIGGIVVKGGKKPGGNMISVTSNNNGEFELNGLQEGNYKFNLTLPSENAKPGSPIGGIVVKGGKNPGGNMTNLMVDKGGNIQFDVLEAGDYKFIIQTPETPKEKQRKKEKVIEKPSSGLKDTLKTNV